MARCKKKEEKMRKSIWAIVFVLSFFIMGCSAHNPFIVKNTYNTATESSYSSHTNKVYLTKETLSTKDYKYEVVSRIDVGKVWYGNSKDVYESMAAMARKLGADAVIEVNAWYQPSGFSWAAPHGSGTAIKFTGKIPTDFPGIEGKWR